MSVSQAAAPKSSTATPGTTRARSRGASSSTFTPSPRIMVTVSRSAATSSGPTAITSPQRVISAGRPVSSSKLE